MDKWMYAGLLMMSMLGNGLAQETDAIKLPPPQMDGGKPLMQVLKERHSTREFGTKPLPQQVLSNLLWAANGVNRADSGKRTAPSARDWREIDVYVATTEGVYRYSPHHPYAEARGSRRHPRTDGRAGLCSNGAGKPGLCGGP